MNDLYNAVTGFIIGDISGVPYKNQRRNSFVCNNIKLYEYNENHFPTHSILWGDNTSLILCSLDSIKHKIKDDNKEKPPMKMSQINEREKKIKEKILKDFNSNIKEFKYFGKFTNKCYDLSKRKLVSTRKYLPSVELIKAVPLAFIKEKNQEKIMEYIKLLNITSKDDITADIGCLIYILLLRESTYKKNIKEALRSVVDNITEDYKIPEYNRIWNQSILYETEDNIISRGFPADVIEASIWCCYNNLSYKNAVLAAVNLGGETDTIAALTGALASVLYGNIPEEWIRHIKKENMIKNMYNIFIKKENRGG